MLRRGAGGEHAVEYLASSHDARLAVEYQAILHVVHEPGANVIAAVFLRRAEGDGDDALPCGALFLGGARSFP